MRVRVLHAPLGIDAPLPGLYAKNFGADMITDERLKWLSGPDYAKSEPGQIAAELLALRVALREATELRESDLDDADEFTHRWRSLLGCPVAETKGEQR
jgi:hypothetical protein